MSLECVVQVAISHVQIDGRGIQARVAKDALDLQQAALSTQQQREW